MVNMRFNTEENLKKDFEKGRYSVMVMSTELVETQAGDDRLILYCEITDGEYEKRQFQIGIMRTCKKSDMAVQIANEQLAQICRSCGIKELSESDDLKHIEFSALLKEGETGFLEAAGFQSVGIA